MFRWKYFYIVMFCHIAVKNANIDCRINTNKQVLDEGHMARVSRSFSNSSR